MNIWKKCSILALTFVLAFASTTQLFAAETHQIEVIQSEGGRITPTHVAVSTNGNHTVTIDSYAGYIIYDVLVDGKSVGDVQSYTFKNVQEDHTITAVFWKSGVPLPKDIYDGPELNAPYYLNSDGEEIIIPFSIKKGDGAWVYKLPKDVTKVLYQHVPVDFSDVQGHPNQEAIEFVAARHLFNLYTTTTDEENESITSSSGETDSIAYDRFAPDEPITRGMFVTMLAKLFSVDLSVYTETPFLDFRNNQSQAGAAVWALEAGIMSGVSDNQFNPDGVMTREIMAVALHRAAEYCGYFKGNYYQISPRVYLGTYADIGDVSGWAMDSLSYCIATGLLEAAPLNKLEPQTVLTRGEAAALVQNFVQKAFNL